MQKATWAFQNFLLQSPGGYVPTEGQKHCKQESTNARTTKPMSYMGLFDESSQSILCDAFNNLVGNFFFQLRNSIILEMQMLRLKSKNRKEKQKKLTNEPLDKTYFNSAMQRDVNMTI